MTSESISITKAIGILLMVLAHAGFPIMHNFIYMFHMPLFFIMSGYCFKQKYKNEPFSFIKKRIIGLYIPFIKWSLIFLIFHNFLFYINIYNSSYGFEGEVSHLYHFTDFITRAIRIIISLDNKEQLLAGYWFLKNLFWGSIISFIIIKFSKNILKAECFLLLLTTLTSLFPIVHIPILEINSLTFLSTSFYVSGYIFHKMNFTIKAYHAIFFFIITIILAKLMPTNMQNYIWWQVIPYFLCAIGGTLMIVWISSHLSNHDNIIKRILIWIGNHTLTILTWHFLSFKLVSLFIVYYKNVPIEQIAYFPVIPEYAPNYWLVYFIIGVAGSLAIQQFINIINKKIINLIKSTR